MESNTSTIINIEASGTTMTETHRLVGLYHLVIEGIDLQHLLGNTKLGSHLLGNTKSLIISKNVQV